MWKIQDGSIPSAMQGMKASELAIMVTLSCKNNLYMCKEMYTWRLLCYSYLVEKPRKIIFILLLLLIPQNVWAKACRISGENFVTGFHAGWVAYTFHMWAPFNSMLLFTVAPDITLQADTSTSDYKTEKTRALYKYLIIIVTLAMTIRPKESWFNVLVSLLK